MWRLSVEDPFEFAGSESEADLCAGLTKGGQIKIFRILRKCLTALIGVIPSASNGDVSTPMLHALFHPTNLSKMATRYGYIEGLGESSPSTFMPVTAGAGGINIIDTGKWTMEGVTRHVGGSAFSADRQQNAFLRQDSEFGKFPQLDLDYSFSEYDLGSAMGSIQGSFYTDHSSSQLRIDVDNPTAVSIMNGILDDADTLTDSNGLGKVPLGTASPGQAPGPIKSMHDRLLLDGDTLSLTGSAASEGDTLTIGVGNTGKVMPTGREVIDDTLASLMKGLSYD
jgi:hypothetical protein